MINQDFSSHEEDQDTEEVDEQLEGIDHGLVQVLDGLTGCPRPDDILLFALPVCAPYDTMLSYKFKVLNSRQELRISQKLEIFTDLVLSPGQADARNTEEREGCKASHGAAHSCWRSPAS